jgi:hypothetical protein
MAQAKAKEKSRKVSVAGRWQGKLLDVGGQTARVLLDLNQTDRRLTGDFSVYIESERDGCCGGGWRLAQVAPVTGSFTEATGRLQLKYGLKLGRAPVDVAFSARMVDADPHASAALVGTYDVSDEAEQVGLQGGACLLWRYRQ